MPSSPSELDIAIAVLRRGQREKVLSRLHELGCPAESPLTGIGRVGTSLLHEAVRQNDAELVKILLGESSEQKENAPSVKWSDPNEIETRTGLSPLVLALTLPAGTRVVDALISGGASLTLPADTAEDASPLTALHHAAAANFSRAIPLLLAGDTIDKRSGRNMCTPLAMAVENGALEAAKSLIERGASPAVPDAKGEWPIHRAALRGDLECVRLLAPLSRGARDSSGNSPLHLALLSPADPLSPVVECLRQYYDETQENLYGVSCRDIIDTLAAKSNEETISQEAKKRAMDEQWQQKEIFSFVQDYLDGNEEISKRLRAQQIFTIDALKKLVKTRKLGHLRLTPEQREDLMDALRDRAMDRRQLEDPLASNPVASACQPKTAEDDDDSKKLVAAIIGCSVMLAAVFTVLYLISRGYVQLPYYNASSEL